MTQLESPLPARDGLMTDGHTRGSFHYKGLTWERQLGGRAGVIRAVLLDRNKARHSFLQNKPSNA